MARPKSKTLYNAYSNSALTQMLRTLVTAENISGLATACGGITEASIRSWTSGATRPDVDKIPIIAQYLGVTTDYLLGVTDVASTDADIKVSCKTTGLSQIAIEALQSFTDKKERKSGINALLTDDRGLEILQQLGRLFSPSHDDNEKLIAYAKATRLLSRLADSEEM